MILTGLLLVSGHWVFVSLVPHAALVYCATRWHLHFSTNPTQFHKWTTNIHTHTPPLTYTHTSRENKASAHIGRTLGYKQGDDMSTFKIHYILAEVPGVAQGAHSYFRRLPWTLGLKLRSKLFLTYKTHST